MSRVALRTTLGRPLLMYADEEPRLEQFGEPETGNGRWHYPYKEFRPNTYLGGDSGDIGMHEWHIAPTDAPKTETHEGSFGRSQTFHYDPNRAHIKPDPNGFRPSTVPNNPDALTDFRKLPDPGGKLWRGMSHEEYEQARQRGYFQSNYGYNLGVKPGDYQADKTFFSTKPDQAAHYATGFAPWQAQPTFTRPAHVVGIPDRSDLPRGALGNDPKSSEVGVPGRIPFDSVTHHWVGNVAAIKPGSVQNDIDHGRWGTPTRSLSPSVTVHWEGGPTSPQRLGAHFTMQEMRERGERYMRDHPDWRNEPGLRDWAQTLGYVDDTPYLNAVWDEDLDDDDDDEPDHLTIRRRVP